jgi:hypothetical protein
LEGDESVPGWVCTSDSVGRTRRGRWGVFFNGADETREETTSYITGFFGILAGVWSGFWHRVVFVLTNESRTTPRDLAKCE